MSDFTQFQQRTPTTIYRIEWHIQSVIVTDPESGEPTIQESLDARAAVLDQNGEEMAVHNADHVRLIELGLLTAEQLIAIRDLLRTFRENVEGILLP